MKLGKNAYFDLYSSSTYYNFGNIIFIHSELDLKSLVEVEVEGFNLVHWGFRRLKMTSAFDTGP